MRLLPRPPSYVYALTNTTRGHELSDTQDAKEERIARALELAEQEVEKWRGTLERLADK